MNAIFWGIKQKSIFFSGLFILLLLGSLFLITTGKSGSFILLNKYHPFLLNGFFIILTFLGNGLFAIILAAIYFFWIKKKQTGITLVYAFLSSGIIAQIIKHLVHSPRPKSFFGNSEQNCFITGIKY